jgi:hypothetical protein
VLLAGFQLKYGGLISSVWGARGNFWFYLSFAFAFPAAILLVSQPFARHPWTKNVAFGLCLLCAISSEFFVYYFSLGSHPVPDVLRLSLCIGTAIGFLIVLFGVKRLSCNTPDK